MVSKVKTHTAAVLVVSISHDTKDVASGDELGKIMIHSMDGKVRHVVKAHDGGVLGLQYFSDGSGIVSCGCGTNNGLTVWSNSLTIVQDLIQDHNQMRSVHCFALSPSSLNIVSGRRDGVEIWSKVDCRWERVNVVKNHPHLSIAVCCICISPDGKGLATGNIDMSISVYDFNAGGGDVNLMRRVDGYFASIVRTLSYSPNSEQLCSGGNDQAIQIWSSVDGILVCLKKFQAESWVTSVLFSPNGRILVGAGNDNKMKIWDAETFELKHTFNFRFRQAVMTADSNFIVSANGDNSVRITSCREYWLTSLTPILNLILHIVYKRKFVSFLEPHEGEEEHEEVMRRLGELVGDGGYNVAGEILSFLCDKNRPVIIIPTRWKPSKYA